MEDNEIDEEKHKKLNELHKRAKKLFAEAADVASSDEEKKEWEDRYRALFKKHEIAWIYTNLKAFSAGLEFGLFAGQNGALQAASVVHLELIIDNMRKEIDKHKINI